MQNSVAKMRTLDGDKPIHPFENHDERELLLAMAKLRPAATKEYPRPFDVAPDHMQERRCDNLLTIWESREWWSGENGGSLTPRGLEVAEQLRREINGRVRITAGRKDVDDRIEAERAAMEAYRARWGLRAS